jgi:hypothetical protein
MRFVGSCREIYRVRWLLASGIPSNYAPMWPARKNLARYVLILLLPGWVRR